ncbi:MAG: hypothetical protein CR980_01255 [Propionibacteriales bacterium]|nr:MAG: hypothetical protein CR980_01255 [Propionibacteriales bacterium]
MDVITRVFATTSALKKWRVTKSGLGCPTWPKCDSESFVPHAEAGIHGAIEFGNRLLTFVLLFLALGTLYTAYKALTKGDPSVKQIRLAAWLILAGIPAQAIVGGLTVLSGLNPFVVAGHFIVSIIIICVATWLLHLLYELRPDRNTRVPNWLASAGFIIAFISIWLGTVVTGSGPHAGDANVARTGFDIATVARLHSLSAWALMLSTIATIWLLRDQLASRVGKAAVILLVVELLQGVIGYWQYFAGVPIPLVLAHVAGVALLAVAATNLWLLAKSYTS